VRWNLKEAVGKTTTVVNNNWFLGYTKDENDLLIIDLEREGLKARIQEMREFLEQQITRIEEYDEQLAIRLIEKITAYDGKFVFQFNSGMTLDLKR
jgi:site-specific DNA recombinase